MSITLHHLNCGTLRPWGLFPFSTIPLFNSGRFFHKGLAVIHCLLIATDEGLILVDTGYGSQDYDNPTRLVSLFNKVIGLVGNPEEAAVRHVQTLGYKPSDVNHIILTHMHLDHTGGLPDFPHAQVHVYADELDMALNGEELIANAYIKAHYKHEPQWQPYRLEGHRWCGWPCTPPVTVSGIEMRLVPTVGHSVGHCMVVLRLPNNRWIVHAGDTYGYHGQIDPQTPHLPRFHWLFRPLIFASPVTRSLFIYDDMLQQLCRDLGDDLTIFCSHDPHELGCI